jgi:hypothetical protein
MKIYKIAFSLRKPELEALELYQTIPIDEIDISELLSGFRKLKTALYQSRKKAEAEQEAIERATRRNKEAPQTTGRASRTKIKKTPLSKGAGRDNPRAGRTDRKNRKRVLKKST